MPSGIDLDGCASTGVDIRMNATTHAAGLITARATLKLNTVVLLGAGESTDDLLR